MQPERLNLSETTENVTNVYPMISGFASEKRPVCTIPTYTSNVRADLALDVCRVNQNLTVYVVNFFWFNFEPGLVGGELSLLQ
jgi:hypothetical protein